MEINLGRITNDKTPNGGREIINSAFEKIEDEFKSFTGGTGTSGLTQDVYLTPFKKLTIENGSITSFDEGEWTYEGVMSAGTIQSWMGNSIGFVRNSCGSLNPDETDIEGVYMSDIQGAIYIEFSAPTKYLAKFYVDGVTYDNLDFITISEKRIKLIPLVSSDFFVTGQTYDSKLQYKKYD